MMRVKLEELLQEAKRLPPAVVAALVDRLTLSLHQAIDSALEAAWKRESRRRMAELPRGEVKAVPREEVAARVRRIVSR